MEDKNSPGIPTEREIEAWPWHHLEGKREQMGRDRRNKRRRETSSRIRSLTEQQKFDREQTALWWKLTKLLNRREFVSYEDLPDRLKDSMEPWDGEMEYP